MTAAGRKAEISAAIDEEIRAQLEILDRTFGQKRVAAVHKSIPREKGQPGKRATFEQRSADYEDLLRAQRLVLNGQADSVWEALEITAAAGNTDQQKKVHAERLWNRLLDDEFARDPGLIEICYLRNSGTSNREKALSKLRRATPALQSERAQLEMVLAFLAQRVERLETGEVRAELIDLWNVVRRLPGGNTEIEKFATRWTLQNPTI